MFCILPNTRVNIDYVIYLCLSVVYCNLALKNNDILLLLGHSDTKSLIVQGYFAKPLSHKDGFLMAFKNVERRITLRKYRVPTALPLLIFKKALGLSEKMDNFRK